jgi:hypothetical protein
VTGWRSAALRLLLCVAWLALLLPPAYAAGTGDVPGSRLCTLQDPEVFESSGLVDRGEVLFTTNDSGDDAVVYGIDAAGCATVSRTRYAEEVEDAEALAPGAGGGVWVGDIGDNRRRRAEIAVHRIRPENGEQPGDRYSLVYPDGAHDAEALLVHPRTQRVFVVSKSVFGGTVYAAPRALTEGSRNRLTAFAGVRGLVTDGAFFPDGRRVLLRSYGTASVYTFPGFGLVGTVRLPAQPHGEGVSVGADGRVLLSSEGVRADVLQVRLPAALTAAPAAAATAAPTQPPRTQQADDRAAPPPRDARDWAAIALVAAVVAAVGWATVRASRSRGPR